ncbi:hypothetical protein WQ54_14500 [Bacillus sp. SA1-12]|nr:hypothetical protein WQ54_14500 [Bacillus sp. SA1-12]
MWKEDAVSHFMTELIDYAGLFPPAALSLTEAIKNYHSYIHGPNCWMLGPFVLPASRLKELEPFRDDFNDQYPLRLSVILSNSEKFESELMALQLFLETYKNAGFIETIEVPLSSQLDYVFLEKVTKQLADYRIFCEITGTNDQLLAKLDFIQKHNKTSPGSLGIKFRMGGITSNLFPTAKQVAFVIYESKQRGLALKFTAGLHHPLRQYREEVETFMHGFVNVFTASIMAYCRSVNKAIIQAILLDEDMTNFSFTRDTLSWCNLTVNSSEINHARNFFAASYGSCSFDEPRQELGELTIFHGEAVR